MHFFKGKEDRQIYLANCFIWVNVKIFDLLKSQLAI